MKRVIISLSPPTLYPDQQFQKLQRKLFQKISISYNESMTQALYLRCGTEPWKSTRKATRKRDLHAHWGVGLSTTVLYSREPLSKWINSMQFPRDVPVLALASNQQSTPERGWICIIVKVTQPVKARTPGFHEVKFSWSVSVWESGDFSTLQLWEERIDHSPPPPPLLQGDCDRG